MTRFWSVFAELSEQDQALLLKFVTSCERPPSLGFASLQPPFTIQVFSTWSHLMFRSPMSTQRALPTVLFTSEFILSFSCPHAESGLLRRPAVAHCVHLFQHSEIAHLLQQQDHEGKAVAIHSSARWIRSVIMISFLFCCRFKIFSESIDFYFEITQTKALAMKTHEFFIKNSLSKWKPEIRKKIMTNLWTTTILRQ